MSEAAPPPPQQQPRGGGFFNFPTFRSGTGGLY